MLLCRRLLCLGFLNFDGFVVGTMWFCVGCGLVVLLEVVGFGCGRCAGVWVD